jgi:hypothetical protein
MAAVTIEDGPEKMAADLQDAYGGQALTVAEQQKAMTRRHRVEWDRVIEILRGRVSVRVYEHGTIEDTPFAADLQEAELAHEAELAAEWRDRLAEHSGLLGAFADDERTRPQFEFQFEVQEEGE